MAEMVVMQAMAETLAQLENRVLKVAKVAVVPVVDRQVATGAKVEMAVRVARVDLMVWVV